MRCQYQTHQLLACSEEKSERHQLAHQHQRQRINETHATGAGYVSAKKQLRGLAIAMITKIVANVKLSALASFEHESMYG